MVDELRRTPETANKYTANLLAIWRHAVRREALAKGPDVDKLKVPEHARRTWTPEQFELIIRAALERPGYVGPVPASIFWPALLLTIANTGGRINSIMRMPVGDVDFERQDIFLRHKNVKDNADKHYPLLPATAVAIDRRYAPR